MDTCAIETGLLKKKPCGEKAVTKCSNCEIALCAKHSTSRMSAGKKVFLCQECARAWKESDKLGEIPSAPAAGAPKPAEKPAPAAPAPKPAAIASKAAPAPKPAAAAPKPAAAAPAKKEEKKPDHDDDAPLEFTPTKK
jgi:hypothetical protein